MKRKTKIIIEVIIGLVMLIGIIYTINSDKKTKTFLVGNYPIEIELNSRYTLIDDKNNFDFYATENENKYLGVFAYDLDKYDDFSIEKVLNDEIKYFENTRDQLELIEEQNTINMNDKTITTIVYLGVKDNSARTIYMFSTITFNNEEKYNALIIQTCKKINYDKYRNEMLENLKNIRIANE